MARRLRFRNMAPAVQINGQWFARVHCDTDDSSLPPLISITSGSARVRANHASGSYAIFLACSAQEAASVVSASRKRALRIDGRVYVRNANSIKSDNSVGVVDGGGYLGVVRNRVTDGSCRIDENQEWVKNQSRQVSFEFDALGIVSGPYAGGLVLDDIRIPVVEDGAGASFITATERDYMTGALQPQWPFSYYIHGTDATGTDGFLYAPNFAFGHCVASMQNRLNFHSTSSSLWLDQKLNFVGTWNAISITLRTF